MHTISGLAIIAFASPPRSPQNGRVRSSAGTRHARGRRLHRNSRPARGEQVSAQPAHRARLYTADLGPGGAIERFSSSPTTSTVARPLERRARHLLGRLRGDKSCHARLDDDPAVKTAPGALPFIGQVGGWSKRWPAGPVAAGSGRYAIAMAARDRSPGGQASPGDRIP